MNIIDGLERITDELITYYTGTTNELKEKVDILGECLFWVEIVPTGFALYDLFTLNIDMPFLYSLPFAIDHLSRLYFRANDKINPEKTHNPPHHTPNIIGKIREKYHTYKSK